MNKKTPKMDIGGFYAGTSMYRDVENQPVSGYGTSNDSKCPPKCPRVKGIDYAKRKREQAKIKPGKCGKGEC